MSEHSKSVLRELSELRKNKRFIDIKLRVGDQQIDCHKCVLSSASPYFKDMFDDDSLDSVKNVVVLPSDTNFSALEAIIDYMYSGSISSALAKETAVLFKTMDFLKMKSMKERCVSFLMANINEVNFLTTFGIADEFCLENLRDASVHFIIENFKKIYCSKVFMELNKNQLESVLKKIDGSNSETTYLAIVGWVKHETENRKDYLEELLDYVSVGSLSSSYCREIILNDDFLKKDPGGRKWLVNNFLSFNSSVKKKSNQPFFILSQDVRSSYKFDIHDKLLTPLESRPKMFVGAFAKYKNYIYGFGKEIKPERKTIALMYNTVGSRWKEFATNSRALTQTVVTGQSGICTKDDKLFLLSSGVSNPFVSYNLETNVWMSLPEPKFGRGYPSICSYNSSFYVLGQPLSDSTCCIERYDDREGKWFREWEDCELPGNLSSVVTSEYIYSLYNCWFDSRLFQLDPRSSKFAVHSLKSLNWASHLASLDGRLYVAGEDGISEYNFHLNEFDEVLKTRFNLPVVLS